MQEDTIKVELRNISKTFNTKRKIDRNECIHALTGITFSVKENEFVSIVGRSGCGKSTLLKIVAGLLKPNEGSVLVNGVAVHSPGLERGMIFQNSSLFPWLTTIKNIEFGPKNIDMPTSERKSLARELIELVGLEGFENKYPRELSGGMQQRVAIARALALDPEILLMDEPFGALDQLTREQMQSELLRIWELRKKTVIFVTHGILESIYLSDRVIVLTPLPGKIKKEFPIKLPRPRQKSSIEFMEYYKAIYEAID